MTEQEWLACTDPRKMLEFLRGKAGDRKLRLFVCGYFRTCNLDIDEPSQVVLETSERFADGLATAKELEASKKRARAAARLGNEAAFHAANVSALDATWAVGRLFGNITTYADRRNKVRLLHDLWGPLPFRPVPINPTWLNPNAIEEAQAIYQEKAFDRLPILADALEEAGCGNIDILNHCRQPGVHVRGCWVIDLLLGKE